MLGEYDAAHAALWFRRGRDLGDGASARRLADLTFSGGAGLQKDPAAAQRLYLEAARLGDGESMYRVSSFIFMSRARPDPVLVGDDATALGWLLKSAELGYLPSFLQLALDYHLGQNTRADDVQALQWLLRAAERGSKEAMVSVAMGYATGGYGLTRDCHQAGRWLRRAQVAGSRDALLELFGAAPKCESYS
jgi:TPR repeat protein